MHNFLAFLYGGLAEASEDAFADGQYLAQACLNRLDTIDNPEQFPPRLLILLASPAYLDTADARSLLDGIHRTFASSKYGHRNIPLIGSTVSAVFFDRTVHDCGALLICLASRMLDTVVAARPAARNEIEPATEDLLNDLELNFSGQGHDPNPLVNRMLLTFLPGFSYPGAGHPYPAPDLHLCLQQKVRARVPIVGGGSSAGVNNRPGLQFANCDVYIDALVGARLTTGFPFTSSIGHGLTPTAEVFHVNNLSEDRRTILSFDQGLPMEALEMQENGETTLGELSLHHDPVINVAFSAQNGTVQMLRRVGESGYLQRLIPEPGKMRIEAKNLVDLSLRRLRIEHPVGCFGIHCSARKELGLSINDMTEDVSELLQGAPYVGGFFEGEIGLGQTGRSLFGNWCVVTVTMGDEERVRTPYHKGFQAIANYTSKLAEILATLQRNETVEEVMKCSVELIVEAGYPGAMLSLVLPHQSDEWLVARQASGTHFERIKDNVIRVLTPDGLLSKIANDNHPRLILNSQEFEENDLPGAHHTNLISQYVIPLKKWGEKKLLGFLQVDLGDIRYKRHIQDTEQSVLDGLGALIESNLVRVIVRKQTLIATEMKNRLNESQVGQATLQQVLQNFLDQALEVLDFDMGHIRLYCPEDNTLVLTAGAGAYYCALRQQRWKISPDDNSPTYGAFSRQRIAVVNDIAKDNWFKELRKRHLVDETISNALDQVGSFFNAPIWGENAKPVGTISLVAKRPWAFTGAKMQALEAINQQLGHLINLYRRRKNLEFLSGVSTDFVRNADFKDPLETMNQAVEKCCRAANAEIGGLFLWDPEIKQFVLRAQYEWAKPEWVDAARFKAGQRWTGSVATAQHPQYLPDLKAHLESVLLPTNYYAGHIFGEDLGTDYVIQALGLPLKLKEQPLGALVMYRRVRPTQMGRDQGFTTTDIAILQEAADNLATMVSAQLYYLRMLWQKNEISRHRLACEALEHRDAKHSLEEMLCLAMIKHFHAMRASFFLSRHQEGKTTLEWAAGYRRCPDTETFLSVKKRRRQIQTVALTKELPDELLMQALASRDIVEHHHYISLEEWVDPDLVKSDGLVDRVCLPLRQGKRVIGVLDLHWGIKRQRIRPMLALHNRNMLIKLAKELRESYDRQCELAKKRKIEKTERSQLAMQTMGVMQFQSAHRLLNLTQDLQAMPTLLMKAQNRDELKTRIEQFAKLIDSAAERVKRPMAIARQVKNIRPHFYDLNDLLKQIFKEPEIAARREIVIDVAAVPTPFLVWIDQDIIREAFRNLIHNAFKAMPDNGLLKITAKRSKRRPIAYIVFEDTGGGMDREEVDVALSGFASTRDSTGLGVLASLLLIRASNGDLKIRSQKGVGTRVFIHLPMEALPTARDKEAV